MNDSDYVNKFVVKGELCKVLIMFNYKGNIGSVQKLFQQLKAEKIWIRTGLWEVSKVMKMKSAFRIKWLDSSFGKLMEVQWKLAIGKYQQLKNRC